MSKLYNDLLRQLETEYKEEAEECIRVYDKLKELNNGSVWQSQWTLLVSTQYVGSYPNSHIISRLTPVGRIFFNGIYAKPIIPRSKGWSRN